MKKYFSRKNRVYGFDNPLQDAAPLPIIASRDPHAGDIGHNQGTSWINETTNDVWMLTNINSGSANWEPIGQDTGGSSPITKYVVDADGTGDYTTIAAAITAIGGNTAMIWVRPGTYTENLTLTDGLIIRGDGLQSIITGVHTPPASGAVIFEDLYLTSATDIITSAAAGTTRFRFESCVFNCTNGYVVDCASWTGPVDIYNCNVASTADGVVRVAASTVAIEDSFVGAGANALTIVGGTLAIINSRIACPISPSGANACSITQGSFIGGTLTTAGTTATAIYDSTFSTGANAAISHGSAGALTISNSTITSSANPCITGAGAGAVTLTDVNFLSNAALAGTLTRAFVAENKSAKVGCGDATYRVSAYTAESGVIQAYVDDTTATGASAIKALLGNLSVSSGDGNHTPSAIEGNITSAAGSNSLQVTGVLGFTEQVDGAVIASTASGVEGWLNLIETDNADLPAIYAFAVKGYLDAEDTTGVPAGIVAGVGSVVEYNTPFNAKAYGMAVSRLDSGGGAGTAGQAAFGVIQGTVAIPDWLYGLDMYGATSGFTNADIRFQNQSTVSTDTEGVTFSGDLSARSLNATNTKVTFNANPLGQLSGQAGALMTGATGTVNDLLFQDGIAMQNFMIGAGQTKIIPIMEADGLEIALDLTATEGVEYNFGVLASNKHAFTIGTSPAFFVEATFKVADVSGCEPLVIGFRKQEANNGTWTSYTDYATIGIVTSQNADLISLATEIGGAGTTYTNTTDAFTDGQTHTLRVNVDASGNATYLIDGIAPSATAAYQFTNALVVMPFIHLVHAAVAPGKIHLINFECGLQGWY